MVRKRLLQHAPSLELAPTPDLSLGLSSGLLSAPASQSLASEEGPSFDPVAVCVIIAGKCGQRAPESLGLGLDDEAVASAAAGGSFSHREPSRQAERGSRCVAGA